MSNDAVNLKNAPKCEDRVFCGSEGPLLHHICLFVPDVDASITFYTEALGLTLREDFEDIVALRPVGGSFPFNIRSAFLEAGEGRFIELHPSGEGKMQPPGFPMNHLAFSVVDVDAAYEVALLAGGLPFGFSMQKGDWDGAPIDVIMTGLRPEPMRMAFLQGPSGELIELYQAAA